MNRRILYALAGVAAALLIGWGVTSLADAYHQREAQRQEQVSKQQDQEAQQHASAAQSIPDHSATVQATQAAADATKEGVARAREQVARAERDLATHAGLPVPVPVAAGSAQHAPVAPDPRDAVIASQKVLIEAQDGRIKALEAANAEALNAFRDEQARSEQWHQAFIHEQQARMAQEAATRAWKQAVKESLWKGRIEGFAVGIATGYAGGKL